MGKKNKTGLGRSLIKDRFASRRPNKGHDSLLHTSDLNDGYDWGRLNLQSVTEQSSFEEFLSTAELAGTEFQAEKLNLTFVNPVKPVGILSAEEKRKFEEAKESKKELLRIPRRPKWNESTSAGELEESERMTFLEWRRNLAKLQEDEGITLTPYEKNLDFWRQLWRVIERSDVVVQILDARNPLLFRCEDLETYVKEVNPSKRNLLLVNKADFLTERQREVWSAYFDTAGISAVFFSATAAAEETILEEDEEESEEDKGEVEENPEESTDKKSDDESRLVDNGEAIIHDEEDSHSEEKGAVTTNSTKVLNREELIQLFESFRTEGKVTIGLVGYPNVGKSSTINALLASKKVSVSQTPGKTKHFQTLVLTPSVTLCDCPGLVMPMMVSSKAEMILAGILPIDQMKDHISPIGLLMSHLPKRVLESHYSINMTRVEEGLADDGVVPTPHHFLDPFSYSRGFMTANGQPDGARGARIILKDFVQGRLLHCSPPPGVGKEDYTTFDWDNLARPAKSTPSAIRATQGVKVRPEDLDRAFFEKASLSAHAKGPTAAQAQRPEDASTNNKKPWKDHSHKRNRKEKLRRVYRHLDE